MLKVLPSLVAAAIPISYTQHGNDWSTFLECQAGFRQSPINLDLTDATNSPAIYFTVNNYQPITNATVSVINGGSTIYINYPN
jgi:carbonic anhydrase